VELGIEGREHWEKVGGRGKIRNHWGSTTLDISIGSSTQRGEMGPAEKKCGDVGVIRMVIKDKNIFFYLFLKLQNCCELLVPQISQCVRGEHLTSFLKDSRAAVSPISLFSDRNQSCSPLPRSCRSQWDLRKRMLLLAELNGVSHLASRPALGHNGQHGCTERCWGMDRDPSEPSGPSDPSCGRAEGWAGRVSDPKPAGLVGAGAWERPHGRWNPVCCCCRQLTLSPGSICPTAPTSHKACNSTVYNKLRSLVENTESHKLLCAVESRRG